MRSLRDITRAQRAASAAKTHRSSLKNNRIPTEMRIAIVVSSHFNRAAVNLASFGGGVAVGGLAVCASSRQRGTDHSDRRPGLRRGKGRSDAKNVHCRSG